MAEREPRTPLHPNAIPEDTTNFGVFGWIAESVGRTLALRLSGLVAMVGGLVATVNDSPPGWLRAAVMITGFSAPFLLLASQLQAWPRGRQWALVLGILAVCGGLFAAMTPHL